MLWQIYSCCSSTTLCSLQSSLFLSLFLHHFRFVFVFFCCNFHFISFFLLVLFWVCVYQCRHFNLIFYGINVARETIFQWRKPSNMSVVVREMRLNILQCYNITMYMHWRLCIKCHKIGPKHPEKCSLFLRKRSSSLIRLSQLKDSI